VTAEQWHEARFMRERGPRALRCAEQI